ncbi:MAG: beta-L-arabinofuranosidase domain-containing protein, partial [Candidatus Latescibacterota bacterium]
MIHRTELRPAPLGQVRVEGGFWGQRREINRRRTLVSQHEQLEQTGRLDGVDPTFKPGDRTAHHIFWDSDIAKWMEAVAYSLTTHPDAELAARLEDAVSRFARLQRPDGYVNSWFTAVEPERRWSNLRDCHELYCAGHLIEAAVAHFGATGKRHFLEVMGRYADYIGSVFGRGPGQRRGYPGHEEIELALVKLHQATGQARHLDLARYFIDERGQQPYYYDQEAEVRGDARRGGYDYCQAHRPVREQDRAVGHAVRAMYLYAGMADIARADRDEGLIRAGLRLWENVCLRQLYVTGS